MASNRASRYRARSSNPQQQAIGGVIGRYSANLRNGVAMPMTQALNYRRNNSPAINGGSGGAGGRQP